METAHDRPERMPASFRGQELLVAAVDAAVTRRRPPAVAEALREALARLMVDPEVVLPDCVQAPVADHYARRELYRSPTHGYSVVAMTWGPGQGTPLHDHAGLWCVEGIWQGELEIVQYALLEQAGGRYRFGAGTGVQAARGSAGSLIPPHEYHTLRNASADAVAISLHVYQAPLDTCSRFCPLGAGWYAREAVRMATDEA